MIDHVSIGVRDLAHSTRFYAAALGAIGLQKLHERHDAAAFGKSYTEFWIYSRPGLKFQSDDTGVHICLRALTPELVHAFWHAALAAGGSDDGAPGPREHYGGGYYAAFVRDPDGHRIEVVTFKQGKG